MTIAEALRESGLASIDAELLAAHACGHDRSWVVAHGNDLFDPKLYPIFATLVTRRKRGEPIAYILEEKEFFGRMFHVSPATLIPRPSTELLVQTVLDVLSGKSVETIRPIDEQIVAWSEVQQGAADVKLIMDVGTGSGCIAITLACERSDLHIIATDISEHALEMAEENIRTHNVYDRITLRSGDGLAAAEPITEPFLLVSNPPYIPENIELERDVMDFEPPSALFAGKEGTDVLHPLIKEARKHPFCRGFVVECREEQILKFRLPTATSIVT
jgi:release factor glutamine methyltransferase